MKLDFYLPVRLYSGYQCLREYGSALTALGSRCMVVTGRRSAQRSGALNDVTMLLGEAGIPFIQYSDVEQNPSVETCYKAGCQARKFGADFIVGVGGGSPMDAAKAVALFTAHPEWNTLDVFTNAVHRPLPVACVPTTAGTGSEANQYSILTLPEMGIKRNINNINSFPAVSYLDARYTLSLPREIAIHTALDALCHCVESYFSPLSTIFSRLWALDGARRVWKGLKKLGCGDPLSDNERQSLLYGACEGGMAISVTGTAYPHPLGYNLTLFHGIPHGAATAVFLPGYLERCHTVCPDMTERLLLNIGVSRGELADTVSLLHGCRLSLTQEEITGFMQRIAGARALENSCVRIQDNDIRTLYEELASL